MDLFKLIEDGVTQPVRDYVYACPIHLQFTRNGMTPFLHACKFGKIEIVHFLWEFGSLAHVTDPQGNTALHIAAKHGHMDTVDFLLTHTTQLNATNDANETALHLAVNHPKIALYLMSKGAFTWIEDSMKRTPLMNAIYLPTSTLALDMIDQGASFCTHGSTSSPLVLSVSCRKFDITMHLLSKGPHFKRAYRLSMVLLVLENTEMSKGILKFMLDKGFNPNSRNRRYHTPLVQACVIKSYDMVKFLLENGASANTRSINNFTPLHLAVMQNQLDIVQLLLQYRANPNFRNNSNETPLSIACSRGSYKIVEALIYHSNLSIKTSQNRTYLMHAVESNHYRIVEKMLYMGPTNLQEEDLDGDTAYDLAIYHDRSSIVELMGGAMRARTTVTMDNLNINIPIPIWRRLLPTEGKRALDVALQAYKVDSLACYHALFLNEDALRKKYRQGEEVCFSQSPIRSLTRAMGSRPIRHRIVSNLIFSDRKIYAEILHRGISSLR